MPTASWTGRARRAAAAATAAAATAATACGRARDAGAPAHPGAPSTVEARAEGDSTRLSIRTGAGAAYELVVGRDSTVRPGAPPSGAEVVGEVPGAAVVVVDTYPSAPGGMSLCQAGEERFLRVVSTRGERAAETLRLKVASCRGDIELASPGLEWLPDSATVRVRWLLGPGGGGAPETRVIRVGPDGRPVPGPGARSGGAPGPTATPRAARA